MIYGGIDGCKAGWLLISHINDSYTYNVLSSINELERFLKDPSRIFIDMPIGLSSDEFPRTIETTLRKELGNRSATVFNAPARPAVYESDREKAKELNKKIEGKSLSEQSLNIKDKILELDLFLAQQKTNFHLIESHPNFVSNTLMERYYNLKNRPKQVLKNA